MREGDEEREVGMGTSGEIRRKHLDQAAARERAEREQREWERIAELERQREAERRRREHE